MRKLVVLVLIAAVAAIFTVPVFSDCGCAKPCNTCVKPCVKNCNISPKQRVCASPCSTCPKPCNTCAKPCVKTCNTCPKPSNRCAKPCSTCAQPCNLVQSAADAIAGVRLATDDEKKCVSCKGPCNVLQQAANGISSIKTPKGPVKVPCTWCPQSCPPCGNQAAKMSETSTK